MTTAARCGVVAGPSNATQFHQSPRGIEQSTAYRTLARIGMGSRAVIYVVLAILTIEVVVRGHPSAQTDATGAFVEVGRQPGGSVFLVALALGLAAYAAWRLAQALMGQPDNQQSGWTRAGIASIGAVYVWLLVEVIELLIVGHSSGGATQHPSSLAATVLGWPGGNVLLGASAVLLGAGSIVFAVWGATRDYARILDRLSSRGLLAARVTGAVGDAARAAAIFLVALACMDAATTDRPSRAKPLGQLLEQLSRHPGGAALICAIGAGFLAYAAFTIIELRYRRL